MTIDQRAQIRTRPFLGLAAGLAIALLGVAWWGLWAGDTSAAVQPAAPAEPASVAAKDSGFVPPPTRIDAGAGEAHHGTFVADPYRWLEELGAPETKEWCDAQAKAAREYLGALPGRDELYRRIAELHRHAEVSPPRRCGDRWFHMRRTRDGDRRTIRLGATATDAGTVLIDPATLAPDGSVEVGAYVPSPTGRYLLYWSSERGAAMGSWRVLEVTGRRDLEVQVPGFAAPAPVWLPDEQGFLYSRFRQKEAGQGAAAICLRRLDGSEAERVVYETDRASHFALAIAEDLRRVVVTFHWGTDPRTAVGTLSLDDLDRPLQPLVWRWKNRYAYFGSAGSKLYFVMDEGAPAGRVVAFDMARRAPIPRTVVAEAGDILKSAILVGDRLVLVYYHDASCRVRCVDLDGGDPISVPLPGLGTVRVAAAPTGAFVDYESYTQPRSLYALDVDTGALTPIHAPVLPFDAAAFETRQVHYQSADGESIPMFVVHREGVARDRRNPAFLSGYGGFNMAVTPRFDGSRIAWMERGGVLAVPALRGGGEFGRRWHEAGRLNNKLKTFEDFEAAAEYLVHEGYTSPEHLGAGGASNGGLTVGAALTRHPERFAAVVALSGVFDMVRQRPGGVGWFEEYGLVEERDSFRLLFSYSPLHNVPAGVELPATLLMTGDSDDVVPPSHSFKFAAALQARGGRAPIVLRVDSGTGHATRAVSSRIAMEVDMFAFLLHHLRATQR